MIKGRCVKKGPRKKTIHINKKMKTIFAAFKSDVGALNEYWDTEDLVLLLIMEYVKRTNRIV